VFGHLLAYLETYNNVSSDDWLVEGDRVNMEEVRKVWGTIWRYLRLFD
jgi:hypothetical protein